MKTKYTHSEETRKKMSLSRLGNTNGFRKGMVPWNIGIPVTPETKAKISLAQIGKHHSPDTQFKKGEKLDEKHSQWMGSDATYVSKHLWIARKLGKPSTCRNCNKTGLSGHRIHWANLSHEYKRELSDWIRLCASCHKFYDLGKLILRTV